MNRPSFIGNYLDFIEDDISCYASVGSTELLSIGSAVGKKLGLVKIGVHIETLPPGRRTSWPHAESDEEEFGFVIEGNPDVWINGELHPLNPGDFVAFPAGTGIAHTFINNSNSVVRLLVGGEASKPTNKITYPLHDERNVAMKMQERFWENHPKQALGLHNGMPTHPHPTRRIIPTFETKRLVLRPLEMSDAQAVFEFAGNPKVSEMMNRNALKNLEEAQGYIRTAFNYYLCNELRPLAVCFKDEPSYVIGSVGAFWSDQKNKIIELGGSLNEKYWGQSIITEALSELIKQSWSYYDVVRIQGRCKVGNTRSRRMLEKLGMNYEGTLAKSLFTKGEHWDMEMFAITR